MSRNSEASRKKILETAIKVFAQKGYDGARMDEIASEAQVNKALIYYYFESKAQILEESFTNFQQEVSGLLKRFLTEEVNLNNSRQIHSFLDVALDFLGERKDLLKIMITESLKSNENEPPLFGFMKLVFEKEMEPLVNRFREQGYTVNEPHDQLLVTEFFTDFVPILFYCVFKDKWSQYFHVDKEHMKALFVSAYTATHIAYHLSQLNGNTQGDGSSTKG